MSRSHGLSAQAAHHPCQLALCTLTGVQTVPTKAAKTALERIADHLMEYPNAKFLMVLEAHTFKGAGDVHVDGSSTLPINLVR